MIVAALGQRRQGIARFVGRGVLQRVLRRHPDACPVPLSHIIRPSKPCDLGPVLGKNL